MRKEVDDNPVPVNVRASADEAQKPSSVRWTVFTTSVLFTNTTVSAPSARSAACAATAMLDELSTSTKRSLIGETRALLGGKDPPFEFDGLRYVSEVEESKAIDASPEPAVIISASGMCEGGRVIHHLKAAIESEKNAIVIVGFQAQHTLGRRIVERRPRVRIFGVERDLRAEVAVLNGFSAHADQKDLVEFAEAVRDRGPLRQVLLVHGEPPAQTALQAMLEARHFPTVRAPAPGDIVTL